ncbi:uncharacterized protein VNE69_06149 [Vairimorpha necatrix]|uniref:Membrane protein n=1 Tax=Vairimorpha necatrix TaxID=6039 RepID=A0AAX4JCV0_9MICR
MKHLKYITYTILYFTSLILDVLITKSTLSNVNSFDSSKCVNTISKYLLTFSKILFIMEIAFYSGFYYIKSLGYRTQIQLVRIFSLIFVIFIGFTCEYTTEVKLSIVVHCITLIFLVCTINQSSDKVYHLYNQRAGLDFLEINLYIIEEMIDTCKKASLIGIWVVVMQDLFSNERNQFYAFHLVKFVALAVDFILCSTKIEKEKIYHFSYIFIGTMWALGVTTIIILSFFHEIINLSLLLILECCYTLLVAFYLIRIKLINRIKNRDNQKKPYVDSEVFNVFL